MKNIDRIIVLLLAGLSATACYNNSDNYAYGPEQAITIAGVQDNYNLTSFVDVLTIDPMVTSTNTSGTFSYVWTLSTSTATSTEDIDTIATSAILEYPVSLPPDIYRLVLDVTDSSNGLHSQTTASLTVTNQFSRGFYLLKELNGGTEMDLHLPDGSVIENLISTSLGNEMSGTPVSLGLMCYYPFYDTSTASYVRTKALGVCTSEGASIFDIADMREIYNHSTMFYTEEPVENPLYMTYCFYGTAYISDRASYFTNASSTSARPGSGKFGYPKTLAEDYSPNVNAIYDVCLFFFDDLNGRFLFMNYNGNLYSYLDEGGVQNDYFPNGIPHRLIHFGTNKVGKDFGWLTGYALFRDQNSSTMYLYTLDLYLNDTDNPITVVDTIEGMNMNNADCFATNELDSHIIYFSVGNQLYYYDILEKTETPVTLSGFGGEQIVFIRNKYWTNPADTGNTFNYLVVGTYTAGGYRIYMYNTLGGIPTGAPAQTLTGTGRVQHIQYVSPLLDYNSAGSNNNTAYYPGSY